jgi:hypothetical protein
MSYTNCCGRMGLLLVPAAFEELVRVGEDLTCLIVRRIRQFS